MLCSLNWRFSSQPIGIREHCISRSSLFAAATQAFATTFPCNFDGSALCISSCCSSLLGIMTAACLALPEPRTDNLQHSVFSLQATGQLKKRCRRITKQNQDINTKHGASIFCSITESNRLELLYLAQVNHSQEYNHTSWEQLTEEVA